MTKAEILRDAGRLVFRLVETDDDVIAAALIDIAANYPATFESIKRELAAAEKAQQYREASRGY